MGYQIPAYIALMLAVRIRYVSHLALHFAKDICVLQRCRHNYQMAVVESVLEV